MDFNTFINNLRSGMDQAGQSINNTVNTLGQAYAQGMTKLANDVRNNVYVPIQNWGHDLERNIGGFFFPQNNQTQVAQPANTTQVSTTQPVNTTQTNVAQPSSNVAQIMPVVQANTVGNLASAPVNQMSSAQTQQQAQPQVQMQLDPNRTYYYRDPGIDTFVNTLRFFMNPIRGITGNTPLDTVADNFSDSMYSLFGKKYVQPNTTTEDNKKVDQEETKNSTDAKLTSATDDDYVTYTYKPGDTFGQVILDLGLGTGNGLWGTNGDVDYYTRQLIEQGALNNYGNIPIGTTIKLRRRK